ncbi:hypothetical protein CR956_00985, partial [Candidatus Saccharibacteria bacterium]
GIDVVLPDVNQSYVEFAVVPNENKIRFGMAAIKGVGVGAVEEIIRARDEGGKFASVADFAKRVSSSKVNKRVWESLIKSGAFDELGDRSDLLYNLESIVAFAQKSQKDAASGQVDLFGDLSDDEAARAVLDITPAPEKYTTREQLMWERELLGLYMSAHPLDNYEDYFEEQTVPLTLVKPDRDGRKVTVGGFVTAVRSIVTKNNKKMAFVKIEDRNGEAEIIVFPGVFEVIGPELEEDKVIKIDGRVSARDRDGNLEDEAKVLAGEIVIVTDEELENYRKTGKKMKKPTAKKNLDKTSTKKSQPKVTEKRSISDYEIVDPKKLFLHIKNPEDTKKLLSIKQLCGEYSGQDEVILVLGEKRDSAIRLPFRVEANDGLMSGLKKFMAEDEIVLK